MILYPKKVDMTQCWLNDTKTSELSKSAEGNREHLWRPVAFVEAWIKSKSRNAKTGLKTTQMLNKNKACIKTAVAQELSFFVIEPRDCFTSALLVLTLCQTFVSRLRPQPIQFKNVRPQLCFIISSKTMIWRAYCRNSQHRPLCKKCSTQHTFCIHDSCNNGWPKDHIFFSWSRKLLYIRLFDLNQRKFH